ncbi:ATP-binding protein [Janthinobacterium lividum]|uniref:ATP-binding protein n=1 Tax=Janthinobacterium lividum TaxID=29581 RepID=A0ABU0XT76_9BURK|nr:ATP-binding protein [Janthinobacterium lividum]MDQ4626715.1 ATP-binding protein [Janthinobacterium lividum]MDQ4674318.1 ATP-binding protein [Janthinobacterium lividum]MDQ4685049.1 ATP-binding protein [Janthinobacterium lividum]
MLNESLIARVAELDKVIILHAAFEKAVLGIEECVLKSRHYLEPVGSLVLAEAGLGKTTVSRALLARMPISMERDAHVERTIVPAFYFEIPSPATVRSVAASMLSALGANASTSGKSAQYLTERLCTLLERSKTILVFADEMHNLFGDKSQSSITNNQVRNWIKTLVNRTGISFCLVGNPVFEPILSEDGQLARRFPMRFHLLPLMPGDQSNPGELVPFMDEAIRKAKQRLVLASLPQFDSLYSATQIYAATGGIPSFVVALIKQAALEALTSGTEHVTLENFAAAWDCGTTAEASIVNENPFRLSHGALATAIRRRA